MTFCERDANVVPGETVSADAFRKPKPKEQAAINKIWSVELDARIHRVSCMSYLSFGICVCLLVWLFVTFISCLITDDMKYFTEMLPDYGFILAVACLFFCIGCRARKNRARCSFLLNELTSGNFLVAQSIAVSVHRSRFGRSRKAYVVAEQSGQKKYPIAYSSAVYLMQSGAAKSAFPVLLVRLESAKNGKCGAFYMR